MIYFFILSAFLLNSYHLQAAEENFSFLIQDVRNLQNQLALLIKAVDALPHVKSMYQSVQMMEEGKVYVENDKGGLSFEITKRKSHDEPALEIYLNDKNNDFLGQISFTWNSNTLTAHLNNIAVIKAIQNKGYGVMLWNKMIEKLKELGMKKLLFTAVPRGITTFDPTWNTRLTNLVNWYKKRGAKETKVEDNAVFMEVDL